MTNYWPLIGILIVIIGFLLRLNPLAVVTAAALATGLSAGKGLAEVVSILGKAFNDNRYVSIVWIALPVIGLLERYGLQQQARRVITGLKGATTGRLLIGYLLFRQLTSALGLTSIAGHAQTVRPLVAPMAEAAAERDGARDEAEIERVKAMSAATDNVGVFFGEDIFIAIGSILLIVGFLDQNGIHVAPLHLSVWAIPTAFLAFCIHGARLLLLDRKLARPERSRGALARNPEIRPSTTLGTSGKGGGKA
ncbi:MAG: DUF969 domain-containing protein [Proteobacteria bacterium]|nr:DUF969 domain-containing protein [Pseudomonadota bacterium]